MGIRDWALGIDNVETSSMILPCSPCLPSPQSLIPSFSLNCNEYQHLSCVEDFEIRLLHPSHPEFFRPLLRWIIVVGSVVNRLMHHLEDMTRSQFIWIANSHIDDINSLSNEFIPLVDNFSKQIGRNFFRRLANCMAIYYKCTM